MTWSNIHRRVANLERSNMDQSLDKGYAICLREYPVDGTCGYEESRSRSKNHEVKAWKIDPNPTNFPGTLFEVIRKTKKISTDYYLRHTTLLYNPYLITFGSRWINNDKQNEFCMFFLDLDCKRIFKRDFYRKK